MLILSRKTKEQIVIRTPDNKDITVKIYHINHNRVKLGIDAPDDYLILRTELVDKNCD